MSYNNGRYMITMMGFFGIYAGLMYNDIFSVGMDLFGSRWSSTEVEEAGKTVHVFELLSKFPTHFPQGLFLGSFLSSSV